jgi:uncharacterized protein
MNVYVDADACPARDEILEVCKRHKIQPIYVANKSITAIENCGAATMVVVPGEFDAGDNWIVEHAEEGDLVLTADLLLAQRAVKKKVDVINFTGGYLTDDIIHDLVAKREINKYLRELNLPSDQPARFGKTHRSRLKSSLHEWIERRKRIEQRQKAEGGS